MKGMGLRMNEPVLVVMAAGMGSRYGGLKQMDPLGPSGEFLMDYSLYDAYQAGFRHVVFVIKKTLESDFRKLVGDRISDYFKIDYVFQELDKTPDDFKIPDGRVKPWGTGHAALCAADVVKAPFCIINADDFYGRQAFTSMYQFLKSAKDPQTYAMVGYQLRNTLTENGTVSRGICQTCDGLLEDVTEYTDIEAKNDVPGFINDKGEWIALPKDTIVSLNLWGFTPAFFPELEQLFGLFLQKEVPENPLKCEFYLPFAVNTLLKTKKAQAVVLSSEEKWYGVTYKEDKAIVLAALSEMIQTGLYPKKLWL